MEREPVSSVMDNASRCPVCFKLPEAIYEPRPFPSNQYGMDWWYLTCPMGHPYGAGGDTIEMSIKHWNILINARAQEANIIAQQKISDRPELTLCKHCLKLTRTKLLIENRTISKQCWSCKLMKSVGDLE